MRGLLTPWRRPLGREARNEQRKLRAAAFNAVAIAATIAATIGPIVTPALAEALTPAPRLALGLVAIAAHLFASFLVRDMEDR